MRRKSDMMKRFISAVVISASCLLCASASDTERIKFIKGNIADKTAAVRESSGKEASDLSCAAVDFALQYKTDLGDDRDLDGLAVAGVLALPADKNVPGIEARLVQLFRTFNEGTVRIAVMNKAVLIKDAVPVDTFMKILNDYVENSSGSEKDGDVMKAAIQTLGSIGSSESFTVLYECYTGNKWPQYKTDIEKSLGQLADKSLPQIIGIIQKGDFNSIRSIFDMIEKNENNSASLKAEIAENVLSETIYIADHSSPAGRNIVLLQMDALRVISRLQWTRASKTVMSFFEPAQREYASGLLTEDEFIETVSCIKAVSPIDASSALSSYLAKMNSLKESGAVVSDKTVLAVITALGAIGDKSSFDSLLAVTYMNYSETIIAAARDALARLKW